MTGRKTGAAIVQQQPDLLGMKDVTPKLKSIVQKADDPHPKKESAAAKKDRLNAEAMVSPKKSTAVAVAQPQAPKEAKNILAIIADAATNPNFNPDSMRALLDMRREEMADQSKRDFNAAFIALQEDLPTIRADGRIEIRAKDAKGERTGGVQQSTPYATFNNIMKAIKPLLIKHGFALSFSTEPVGERLLVKGYLDGHGHQRTTAFPLPAETSGSKNNVQGWGSSMSYGKRYATIALLNLVSEAKEDRDLDGNAPPPEKKGQPGAGFPGDNISSGPAKPITATQRDKIVDLITGAKIKESQFCAKYGIAQIGMLPADQFDAAVKAIADHVEAAKAGTRG
jgi:hypothetical protein